RSPGRRRFGSARGRSGAAARRDARRSMAAGQVRRSLPRGAPRRHRPQARRPRGGAGRGTTSPADEGRRPDVGAGGEPQSPAQAGWRARARPARGGRRAQAPDTEARVMTSAARVLELDDRRLLLNHLDEVLWPDVGVTKGDLIDYYLDVA